MHAAKNHPRFSAAAQDYPAPVCPGGLQASESVRVPTTAHGCSKLASSLSASTAILPSFNNIFCRPEGLDAGRHSAINSCLKQNFLNFLCRTTVAQGAQHMSL